jgi:hypothetical protein
MYALLRWRKFPVQAAGYDYSSRDLDHNFHSHGVSNARATSRRGATRVSDDDDDSEHSLCDRGYPGVDADGKKRKTSVSAADSVNSGLEDGEGIVLEERGRSVG